MKTISLLKAVLSEDMNLFRYSVKRNSSKLKKALLPILLFLIVCYSIGFYAYMIAKVLSPLNLTYVMLTMFVMMVSILSFIEGIYKSQGILFECKDNDLLFSLPIKKSKILFVRIFKLLLFQYIYNLMFLLPAFVIYIYYESPNLNFYLISLLITFLIPIIPTVISSLIGYIIKLISSKSKSKKIVQTIITSIVFLGVFYLSFNIESFIQNLGNNATSINDIITRIYYPVGLYINLINKFNILDLIKLLLINIIPFILFILIGSVYYFKIIFNSKETSVNKKKNNNIIIKQNKPIISLAKKELSRYFSSVVYMFNTSFGLLLSVIVSILLCIKGQKIFDAILIQYQIKTSLSIDILFYFLILFSCSMTSISSSQISLEGKTINITKSLPINEKTILKAKILSCFIIELPFILLSEIIFIIKFKPSILHIIFILLLGLMLILFSACLGLIVNLKYPKLNYSNDTEVIKQSTSSMISVFTGMGVFLLSVILIIYLLDKISFNLVIILHLLLLFIITSILYIILMRVGTKEYKKLNI